MTDKTEQERIAAALIEAEKQNKKDDIIVLSKALRQMQTMQPAQPELASAPDPEQTQEAENYLGSGYIEPAMAIGSNIGRMVSGGMGVIGDFAMGESRETATQNLEEKQAQAFQPQTPAGKAGMETVGDLMETVGDIANFPLSGIAGLAELVRTGDLQSATQMIQQVQDKGMLQTMGEGATDMATDAGMSPEVAAAVGTGVQMLPEMIGSAVGGNLARGPANAAQRSVMRAGSRAGAEVRDTAQGLNTVMRPSRREMANRIAQGDIDSTFKDLAGHKVELSQANSNIPRLEGAGGTPRTLASRAFDRAGVNVLKSDGPAKKAIRAGWEPREVRYYQDVSGVTAKKMSEMANIKRQLMMSKKYEIDGHRTAEIPGDALAERVRFVRKVNMESGSSIDALALKELKGAKVDFEPAIRNFQDNLNKIGVVLKDDGELIFRPNSPVRGIPGIERILKRISEQLKTAGRVDVPIPRDAEGLSRPVHRTIDALDIHDMKRLIDEQVSYGKSVEGLSGRTVNIVKELRKDFRSLLENDDRFPGYNAANKNYSESITALDELQSAVGKQTDLMSIDFSAGRADAALGQELRKLMTNYRSRTPLENAIDKIIDVSARNGARFDDDLNALAHFVEDLDIRFGPTARRSHEAVTARGAQIAAGTDPRTMAVEGAAQMVNRKVGEMLTPTDEEAFRAIFELLNSRN